MTLAAFLAIAFLTACAGEVVSTPEAPAGKSNDLIVAEGHIIPGDNLYLSLQVRGEVEQILVKTGDYVRKGDILVSLSSHQSAEAALAAAKLEYVAAVQALDTLTRTANLARVEAQQAFIEAQDTRAIAAKNWEKFDLENNAEDITDAEADIVTFREDLEDAQAEFDKFADLDEDNSKRENAAEDLEKSQENYNESIRKLEKLINKRDGLESALKGAISAEAEAQWKLENTLSGPDKDQMDLATARLENAKAQMTAAQHNLDLYILKAPFDGLIVDTNIIEGEWIGPEKWAVLIADFSEWFVDTSDLSELDVININIGETVSIKPDALPELDTAGMVEEISQVPDNKGGDVLYKVHIRLLDNDPRLRWGMTVEVSFNGHE
jgi:multidrug efflux pump subunit AcrA (membrane-fusion protein)